MTTYKRIIQTTANVNDLLSHAIFGVKIRRAVTGENEWVVETDDRNERMAVDKIVALFDGSAA